MALQEMTNISLKYFYLLPLTYKLFLRFTSSERYDKVPVYKKRDKKFKTFFKEIFM